MLVTTSPVNSVLSRRDGSETADNRYAKLRYIKFAGEDHPQSSFRDEVSIRNFAYGPISNIKPRMHYTILGRSGLRVSVAGLGTGGFSRMALKSGKFDLPRDAWREVGIGVGS
jgi:hypothetical protein